MIEPDVIDILLRHQSKPAVSIMMSCHVPGSEISQDPMRLDDLLKEARRRLVDQGYDAEFVTALLEPARSLVNDTAFWAQGRKGLALFLAPGFVNMIDLDLPAEEIISTDGHFRIRGLLPHLAEPRVRYFVLAFSEQRAVLYQAGEDRIDPDPIFSCDKPIGAAAFEIGAIDDRIRETIGPMSAPIVLAAKPDAASALRMKSPLRSLLPERVDINPFAVSLEELHRLAWAVVGPLFATETDKEIDHLNSLQGSSRATTEPSELVKAARCGQIDTLFLGLGAHVWGRFDEQNDRVEAHSKPQPGDDDLLDMVARQTLLNGGQVRVVPLAQLPDGAPAAGIMRF